MSEKNFIINYFELQIKNSKLINLGTRVNLKIFLLHRVFFIYFLSFEINFYNLKSFFYGNYEYLIKN